jgi:cyclopropane-fatty-acyl-phospholipid synthase
MKGTSHVLKKMDVLMHRLRQNTRETARKNIEEHYDLSNEMYKTFLDPSMMYSSGIFTGIQDSLETSQAAKIDRLIDRLHLLASDHVLEIGSGWGGCAIRMAQKTGCRVTSLTLSPSQQEEAMQRVRAAGLEDRVEIRLQDYRDVEGQFSHVISIEMIEAVGHEFLPEYFRTVNDRLKPGGRFALQAITIPDDRYEHYTNSSDFIRKHIFPGGHLPSPEILENMRQEHTSLKELDNFEFGPDYAETLRRWRFNFFASLEKVRSLGFDDRFIRKWHYYLAYCEAGFDTGMIHVRQICYEKA